MSPWVKIGFLTVGMLATNVATGESLIEHRHPRPVLHTIYSEAELSIAIDASPAWVVRRNGASADEQRVVSFDSPPSYSPPARLDYMFIPVANTSLLSSDSKEVAISAAARILKRYDPAAELDMASVRSAQYNGYRGYEGLRQFTKVRWTRGFS